MRQSKEFEAFGTRYRVKQFAAVQASEIAGELYKLSPTVTLEFMEVFVKSEETDRRGRKKGEWWPLGDADNIDDFVRDAANILPPHIVLQGLISEVEEVNFEFLKKWKPIKVPQRFQLQDEYALSHMKRVERINPIVSQLVSSGAATMRELEEYYSLEDAFQLFDMEVTKGVNAALAQEAAMKEAKKSK